MHNRDFTLSSETHFARAVILIIALRSNKTKLESVAFQYYLFPELWLFIFERFCTRDKSAQLYNLQKGSLGSKLRAL